MVHIASHQGGQTQDGSTGELPSWMNVITALRRGLRDSSPSAAALGTCWHSALLALAPQQGEPELSARRIIFHKSLLSWIWEHWSHMGNVTSKNYFAEIQGYFLNQACIRHSQLKYCCSHLPGTEWKHRAPHTPLHPASFMTQLIPHFFASFSLLPAKVSQSVLQLQDCHFPVIIAL